MNDRYILLLIALGIPAATLALENQDENITVTCYVDFDIFVSHEEKFCNGTKLISGNLLDGIYFQYRTNVTGSWVTLDVYNATKSIKEHVLEFQSNNTQFLWVQFRWIQFDTIGSPVWAIDDILIDCLGFFFRSISFEENPDDYNKNFICHSGFQQGGAQECTDTQYSLLLNGTNRELRMSNFNLLNDTSKKGDNIPNNCQPQNCFGPSLSHGFIWSTTQVNETARMQCSEISGVFWSGLYATRKCLDGGVWDEVDMSQCTIKDSNKMPFIVYSLYLEIPEFINSSYLTLNQLHQSLDVYNTSYSVKLHTKVNVYSVTIISFTITFNDDIPVQGNDTMMEVAKHLVTTESNYSSSGLDGFPEVVIMYPVDACLCKNSFISEEELLRIIVINACVGIPIPPCTAYDSDSGSKCNEPHYTGNITHCAIANMSNETQYDCSEGYDMEFGIGWKGMRKNSTVSQRCPNGTGDTLRLCDSLGNWQVPDMQMCNSSAHHKLFEQICNMTASTIDISELNNFLTDLAERIHPNNFSVFPRDLKTVNSIIEKILIALEENSTLLRQEEINIAESLLNIYDSIFDSKNEPGFQQLMEIDRAENQKLIILSEKFGMLLATNTNAENDELAETLFVRENFVISVQRSSVRDISFRPQLNQYNQTSIHIPSQLLEQKSKDVNGVIPIVNIVYKTLHMFLPITINTNGQMKELVSIVVSSQVGNRDAPSLLPLDNPVTLKFDHNAPNAASNLTRCGFWNFTLNQTGGNGGWDSSNVMVAEESQNGKIVCHSLHLTCFAVLVDVSVVSGPSDFSSVLKKQEMELSIVTYIGCGISVIFLLIAIAFLIMFRNTILQSVDNFIHLNLSIALFLALIVFLAGIETATDNQAACTVVAALLHYLFTAVFSWMLCEGILLYFLIVKVLSFKFTKKKWPYFILGWGIPIPIVATAVGIAHHHYGNNNYCWISIEDVTIWAFVGPMLLIVLVNAIVLIMVLLVLFKAKSQNISADEAKQVDIVKSLMKGAVVLLPLLGVTWVFGLLAVNEDLIVFAWIFAILNSLQGFLILLFYVLRNKKVREKVKSTVSLKIYGTSTPNSPPPTEAKTGTSVKINIERYEGNTMDGTKTIDDSNCYASTVKTSCSEGENDTSQMSLTYWQR